MSNSYILKICQQNSEIRKVKIKSIEHAITNIEIIIKESNLNEEELIYLKQKISNSRILLEMLYLMDNSVN